MHERPGSSRPLKLATAFIIIAVAIVLSTATAVADEWRRYVDPEFGYAIDLPDGFEVEADPVNDGLTLFERGGRAQIDVYGLKSDQTISLRKIRETLAEANRIREITYSRSGASWFVVSGYYRRLEDEATDLIFYAKFMLSSDRKSLSAFEASYPISDKRRFDPIIERIEDSLTRPRS